MKTINKIFTSEIGTNLKTVTGTISPYPSGFNTIPTNDTDYNKNSLKSTGSSKVSQNTSGSIKILTSSTDSNTNTLGSANAELKNNIKIDTDSCLK